MTDNTTTDAGTADAGVTTVTVTTETITNLLNQHHEMVKELLRNQQNERIETERRQARYRFLQWLVVAFFALGTFPEFYRFVKLL